jgi:hypothetical protein
VSAVESQHTSRKRSFLQNLTDAPVLVTAERLRFYNHYLIAYTATIVFVVDHESLPAADEFLVDRMKNGSADLYHYGLIHFVADHYAGSNLALLSVIRGVRH